jgi:diguanylate cyclase (GGDEF)-like protein/PAS domain S-box-containing protein
MSPSRSHHQLLLIEDSEAIAVSIRERLERSDLATTTERVDQMQALQTALGRKRWSAILYDNAAPGLPFEQTINLLRERCPHTPVILVTDSVSEDLAANLLQHGFSDFVLKHNLLRLPTAIHRAVEAASERLERQAAEEQLRKLAMVVEQSPTSIIITNTQPTIEYVNQAFLDNTGYTAEEVLGSNPSLLNKGLTPGETYRELWKTVGQGEVWKGEFRNSRKDGSTYLELATIAPIRAPSGEITHYVAVKSDITDLRRSESRVYELANYDDLTGLPNRSLLLERVDQVALFSQQTDRHGMLVVLDVDGFKFINDTHGYQVGNEVLKSIATRLGEVLTDNSTIARIGDNRFAIVVENLSRKRQQAISQAHGLAGLVHDELQSGHIIEGVDSAIRHATTMGGTLIDQTREQGLRLLNKAEIALQQARNNERNTWQFFNAEMQMRVESQASIEGGLHEALENNHLEFVCQSQFNAQGHLTGAEGMVRWNKPGQGQVSPGEFIPLAEETGQILPIGAWVMETACQQLAQWAQDSRTSDLHLSVNVSARQFHQPHFVESLLDVLDRFDLSPGQLSLELTESVVLKDLGQTEQRMLAVRDLGIGLALDDFGTGFSSLSYLKNLPFDTLKIDRSFVADMISTTSSAAIVRAIIDMGHALDLTVVAEGIETIEEWSMLKDFDCDIFQGYLFARPVPAQQWQPADFQIPATSR